MQVKIGKWLNSRKKGSVLIATILTTLILSFIVLFCILSAQQDTRNTYRKFRFLQGRYMAEGAINIAKGDVLTQIASVNFLADESITVDDHYSNVVSRFGAEDYRIPGDMRNISWKESTVQDLAFWDFEDQESLEGADLKMTDDDWNVAGQDPYGSVRVYVTQSDVDSVGDVATDTVGSYLVTLTAVSNVHGIQNVVSSTFQHKLGTPQLFKFLMLGSSISDCSVCHIHLWGDIGQVNPADPIQTEFDYNQWGGGKETKIYGSIYTNGDVYRDSFIGNEPFELHLVEPGVSGSYDGWTINKRKRIYSRNGSSLQDDYLDDNPGTTEEANPYQDISLDGNNPLPTSWPSVKDNMMTWFEPKATLKASDGTSVLQVSPRDNSIKDFSYVRDDSSNVIIGDTSSGTASYYEYAIDRVFPRDVPFKVSGTDSYRDTGLHPFDDLDGDSIPNVFDANIDDASDTDPDSYPETERGSSDPSNLAYRVTYPELADYFVTDSVSGQTVFTLGRPTPAAGTSWDTRDSVLDATILNDYIVNNPIRISDVYRREADGFYWNADLSGIATSMENLVENRFASTPGESPGTINGVFPNNSTDVDGNPVYPDSDRSLIVRGTDSNPINSRGSVVIRGDAVVTGTVTSYTDPVSGEKKHGQIITHRNIYVPTDLQYKDEPNWDDPDIANGDQLGLVAGGNIMIGNYIQMSIWNGKSKSNTDTAREGNDDPDNYYQGIMPFVWGNMIDPNDENLYKWYWGRDGSGGKKFNHMINPVYVMDGGEGGTWENGEWVIENEGNTVDDRFKGNNERIQIGGGLDNADDNPHFNEDRKHQNYFGNTHTNNNKDSKSYYKNFFISTPGLLPIGADRIPYLPSGRYGQYSNSWFNSEDLKVLTQKPKFNGDISTGDLRGTLGEETNDDSRWIKKIQSILYADNGVIGGSLLRDSAKNPDNEQALQFYGTVIGKDIQIMAAGVNGNSSEKYTNRVGALYYDQRLRQAKNPLDFPFSEGFEGGEMTMNGYPQVVDADGVAGTGDESRDNWRPYRVTEKYFEYFED